MDAALEAELTIDAILARPRYAEPGRLPAHGYKIYSQTDEDGILAEIFRRVGTTSRRFVEIGVGNGLQCNSLALLLAGWSGVWVDRAMGMTPQVEAMFAHLLASGALAIRPETVGTDNIARIVAEAARDEELDLLSIDIDGNDYWVWEALAAPRPRVVVVEYNAAWRPPLTVTMAPDPDFDWHRHRSNYFGTSLGALERLADAKGYALVGCNVSGVNAFFVRRDLPLDAFCAPFTAANHYEPARYALARRCAGHPPNFGPVVTV